jgi:hypothetical protein
MEDMEDVEDLFREIFLLRLSVGYSRDAGANIAIGGDEGASVVKSDVYVGRVCFRVACTTRRIGAKISPEKIFHFFHFFHRVEIIKK